MLENLINLVKQHAGDAIVKNDAIPNDQNDAAISHTASGIMDALKSQVSSGGIKDVAGLLSSSGGNANALASNPMIAGIITSVAGSLATKFGLSPTIANGIVSNMIPSVMNSLISKTNDKNDSSFDIQGILGALGGGKMDIQSLIGAATKSSGGIGGLIGKLFGR